MRILLFLCVFLLCQRFSLELRASGQDREAPSRYRFVSAAKELGSPSPRLAGSEDGGVTRNMITMDYVPTDQSNVLPESLREWSCGISSLSRITRGLGYPQSYQQLGAIITPYDIPVRVNLCTVLSLGFLWWIPNSDSWCTVTFYIGPDDIAVGNPPPEFVKKINQWAGSGKAAYEFAASEAAGLARIHELIDSRRPVIVNIMVGDFKFRDKQGNAYIETPVVDLGPFGTHTINILAPEQHYVVVYGYDTDNVFIHDTTGTRSYSMTNAAFMKQWAWRMNYYSRYANFLTEAMWDVGARPLGLLYMKEKFPNRSPGCGCDCCCTQPCFCLTGACGCTCNIPDTHDIDIYVKNSCSRTMWIAMRWKELSPNFYNSAYTDWMNEGTWQSHYWYKISAGTQWKLGSTQSRWSYIYAIDSTTGEAVSGTDRYEVISGLNRGFQKLDMGGSLGINYIANLKCGLSLTGATQNYRIHVKNSCGFSGPVRVLVYYYDMGTSSWRWVNQMVGFSSTIYFGKSTASNVYYYAEAADFVWSGSDLTRSYGGVSYGLRKRSMGSTYREYILEITCTCTPVNCVWGSWGAWGSCQYNSEMTGSPSGGYVQMRTRSVSTRANACGASCSGASRDFRDCEAPCPDLVNEPNDALASATQISLPYSTTRWICPTNDEDWYKFYLSSSQALRISLTYTHQTDGDVNMRVIDASGTSLAASVQKTGTEFISFIAPSSGTYYLRVYVWSGKRNSYSLSIRECTLDSHCPADSASTCSAYGRDWSCSAGKCIVALQSLVTCAAHEVCESGVCNSIKCTTDAQCPTERVATCLNSGVKYSCSGGQCQAGLTTNRIVCQSDVPATCSKEGTDHYCSSSGTCLSRPIAKKSCPSNTQATCSAEGRTWSCVGDTCVSSVVAVVPCPTDTAPSCSAPGSKYSCVSGKCIETVVAAFSCPEQFECSAGRCVSQLNCTQNSDCGSDVSASCCTPEFTLSCGSNGSCVAAEGSSTQVVCSPTSQCSSECSCRAKPFFDASCPSTTCQLFGDVRCSEKMSSAALSLSSPNNDLCMPDVQSKFTCNDWGEWRVSHCSGGSCTSECLKTVSNLPTECSPHGPYFLKCDVAAAAERLIPFLAVIVIVLTFI